MTVPSGAVARRAARVLLLDADGRVLLFRGGDPGAPERGTWWITPGGGLDEGETHVQGAARELFEETGLRLEPAALGEPVLHREADFHFDGVRYAQAEQFFLARVGAHEVDTRGFTSLELRSVVEHRWWGREDLRATTDTVYPEGLVALLDRLAP
jgi:8-oxo-dGTP pyrophosphatase MutT (NUDIX family)